jgi:hypothetical protein
VQGQPAAVAVLDGDWTLASVDQATADLLGRRRGELASRTMPIGWTVGHRPEDDVAIVAVRCRAQDGTPAPAR